MTAETATSEKSTPPIWLIPMVIATALFMENMDSSVIATSLPAIASDLGEDPVIMKLALTSYLLALAVFIPISGWCADRYGARTVFQVAIAIFIGSSIACASADSLWDLIIARSCQGVGGGYEGRMMGSIGHAGAFSFNYFKNMTCGEGGAVVTNDDHIAERARCAIDPCHFYWQGQDEGLKPFAGAGARASELMGAMLNVQLDRIDGIIGAMRTNRQKLLDAAHG